MNIYSEALYKLTKKDIDPATNLLVEAFKNDFSNIKLLEKEKNYERSLNSLLKLYVTHITRAGNAFADSEELNGVSMWQNSLNGRITPIDFITKGAFKFIFKINPKTLYRLNKIDKYLRKAQQGIMPQEHIYLSLLGVKPNNQGKGIGSHITNHMLKEIDKHNLPCYLGVRKERNIGFYEKFGFKVVQQLNLPILNIPTWIMTRT